MLFRSRNRAQTLLAQGERRLRDASLELGPYGAERQQRAVETAMADLRDSIEEGDDRSIERYAGQLEEALYGLNRRLSAERRGNDGNGPLGGPLQGLRNTLGTLRDELFAEDDWEDDWDRPAAQDRGRRRERPADDPWGRY